MASVVNVTFSQYFPVRRVCVLDCCICSSNIAQYEWLTKQKIKPLARPASPNNAIFYGYWIWKQKNYWQNGENIQRQIHRKYISQLRSAVLSVSNNIILKLNKSQKYGNFHTFAEPPTKVWKRIKRISSFWTLRCFNTEELLSFFLHLWFPHSTGSSVYIVYIVAGSPLLLSTAGDTLAVVPSDCLPPRLQVNPQSVRTCPIF